jgi:hypothetical protein
MVARVDRLTETTAFNGKTPGGLAATGGVFLRPKLAD